MSRQSEIEEINKKYDDLDNLRNSLMIGQEIYEIIPRYGDIDYHPQIIEKINEEFVDTFEESINRRKSIPIKSLRVEKESGWIVH